MLNSENLDKRSAAGVGIGEPLQSNIPVHGLSYNSPRSQGNIKLMHRRTDNGDYIL